MYKSRVVKLVFLNSVLALSGCSRSCEDMEDGQQVVGPDGQPRSTCHGSRRTHVGTGVHVVPILTGGGRGVSPGAQPGSGTVARGGFGSTGAGAAG